MSPAPRGFVFASPYTIPNAAQERKDAIAAQRALLRCDPEGRAWGALTREAEIIVDQRLPR